jgi:hypothetical protein
VETPDIYAKGMAPTPPPTQRLDDAAERCADEAQAGDCQNDAKSQSHARK